MCTIIQFYYLKYVLIIYLFIILILLKSVLVIFFHLT